MPSGRRESSSVGFSFDTEITESSQKNLSLEQEKAVQEILESANTEKTTYHYLYGPTGTGKTEVFLQVTDNL